jgi:hypothetical protein
MNTRHLFPGAATAMVPGLARRAIRNGSGIRVGSCQGIHLIIVQSGCARPAIGDQGRIGDKFICFCRKNQNSISGTVSSGPAQLLARHSGFPFQLALLKKVPLFCPLFFNFKLFGEIKKIRFQKCFRFLKKIQILKMFIFEKCSYLKKFKFEKLFKLKNVPILKLCI